MARAEGATGKGRRRSGGRIEPTPCAVLGDDRFCEPLNKVWLLAGNKQGGRTGGGTGDGARSANGTDARVTKRYGACTCGRRFPPGDVPKDLPTAAVGHLAARAAASSPATPAPATAVRVGDHVSDHLGSSVLGDAALAGVVRDLWPVDRDSAWARTGVVPVGQPVLHEPTDRVEVDGPSIEALAARLLQTQTDAEGIGLAANQVGAPVRALAHNLRRIAPPIFLNAVLLDSWDEWDYEEGCLSLHLDGTWAEVCRPKVVVVHADLLDGTQVVVEADELFSRVLQHELDHLDGIEYVQRLTGREADRVYALMRTAGIDTATWLPPRPY